jgi:hypothetical protein
MWTIQGLALPYDVEAKHEFRRWRFAREAIEFEDRVPFLRDHDNGQRRGWVSKVRQLKAGLKVFGASRVRVPEGTPLSAGILPLDVEEIAGITVVRRARLLEVSMVKRAAFLGAAITERKKVA